MNKMQEEFEAWKRKVEPSANLSKADGIYISNETFFDWQAWRASRKALVVELPVTVCRTHVFEIPYTHEIGMEHDEYFEVDDIHKALDAAGVAYK